MIVRIEAAGDAQHTEKRYHGVQAEVVGSFYQQWTNKESPFILVRPLVQKCPLVGEIYVKKTCVRRID